MTNIIRRCNRMLRDLGLSPLGDNLYKWVHAPTLKHYRYRQGNDDWKRHSVLRTNGPAAELWLPSPTFEQVTAFPYLGDRWLLCMWQPADPEIWNRIFGSRVVCPRGGYYFPTNKVLKLGQHPTADVTEYLMQCVRYHRTRTAADFDREMEDEFARQERQSVNRMYDQILDLCTAYGNKPGCRSGGVSIFSEPGEKRASENRVNLSGGETGGTSVQSQSPGRVS